MNTHPASRRHAAAWLATATLLFATVAAQAQAARYEIDPNHLSIGFLVEHLGYAKVQGMFRTARGSYSFDEGSGALTDVRVEVDTASVFSNHVKRDEHLKGPVFLNVAEHPKMVFTASGAKRTGVHRERGVEMGVSEQGPRGVVAAGVGRVRRLRREYFRRRRRVEGAGVLGVGRYR